MIEFSLGYFLDVLNREPVIEYVWVFFSHLPSDIFVAFLVRSKDKYFFHNTCPLRMGYDLFTYGPIVFHHVNIHVAKGRFIQETTFFIASGHLGLHILRSILIIHFRKR